MPTPAAQLHRRKVLSVAVLLWLVMALATAGGTYYVVEQDSRDLAKVHNVSTCAIRRLLSQSTARSLQAAADATQSPSSRARARSAIASNEELLGSLPTIPRGLNCNHILQH